MKHSAPSLPKRRAVRLGLVLTPVLAVAVGTSVIWQTSYAAFSATTDNGVNNWRSGSVDLTDDDGSNGGGTGTAMFNVSNIRPGSNGARCITVTSNGTLPASVKLYASPNTYANTKSLAESLNLTITSGTGGGFGSCDGYTSTATLFTGKVSGFAGLTTYGSGVGTWMPGAGTETRTYQFSYSLPDPVSNTTQGGSTALSFTWESQNQNTP